MMGRAISCIPAQDMDVEITQNIGEYFYASVRVLWPISRSMTNKFHANERMLETEAAKFGLPIGQLTYLTNRKSEISSLSHKSRAKKSQCKRNVCS